MENIEGLNLGNNAVVETVLYDGRYLIKYQNINGAINKALWSQNVTRDYTNFDLYLQKAINKLMEHLKNRTD